MSNVNHVSQTLLLTQRGAAGEVLTRVGADEVGFAPGAVIPPAVLPYPLAAPATPNANNEEFTGTLAAWTVQLAVVAPNVVDVNTNANSRVLAHIASAAAGTDGFRIAKTLSGAWAGNISMTAEVGLSAYANFGSFEFGFLQAGLNSGPIVLLSNQLGAVALRNYSDWGVGTNAGLFAVNGVFGVAANPPDRFYAHLQRVGGTWSVWLSSDAASWRQIGTDATAFAITGAGLQLNGFAATAPYVIGTDFIRFNWLFLP